MSAKPARLGKYAVIRKVASGGMAEVYLGRLEGAEGFRKKVAVKVIHPRFSEDARFRDLFAREARIAAACSHPNLVQVFDFGREGRSYFLAMEFVEGCSLAEAAARMRIAAVPPPLPVWRYWMEGILSGLGYLHARGIVHRDISPSNVLLSRGGLVKIADLGIARIARGSGGTDARGPEGKAGYMAPEQARGEEATPAMDLFAAAVVGTELFLPRRLFEGGPAADAGRAPASLRDADARILSPVPDAVAGLLRKGLSSRPEDRPGSAEEFMKALAAAVPATAGRDELATFWDEIFPSRGPDEEETLVSDLPAGGRGGGLLRERRGLYGGRSGWRIPAAVASGLAVLGACGLLAWQTRGAWTGRSGAAPLRPADPVRADRAPAEGGPKTGAPGTSRPDGPGPYAGDAARRGTAEAMADPGEASGGPVSPPGARSGRVAASPSGAAAPKSPTGTADRGAAILLETDPAGVSVGLEDGTALGRTPLLLDKRSLSGRRIVLSGEGLVTRTIPASALAARRDRLRMAMDRQTGTIEAVNAIPWAKVYDGNRDLGETPIQNLSLPVGERRLRFVNPEMKVEKAVTVTVRPGPNPRLIVPLVEKREGR